MNLDVTQKSSVEKQGITACPQGAPLAVIPYFPPAPTPQGPVLAGCRSQEDTGQSLVAKVRK
jgi:hypothetical protein